MSEHIINLIGNGFMGLAVLILVPGVVSRFRENNGSDCGWP